MFRAGLLLLAAVCLTACGGIGQPEPYPTSGVDGLVIPSPSPDPTDFVADLDNQWLALDRHPERDYEILESGIRVGELRVEVTGSVLDVAGIKTTAVRHTSRVRGEGREVTTSYLAQDRDGNVWLLGEDLPGERWRVAEGIPAGLAMPAKPRVGDAWVRTQVTGELPSLLRVDPESAQTLGSGSVTIEVVETGARLTYAEGVGLVRVGDLPGGVGALTRSVELVD